MNTVLKVMIAVGMATGATLSVAAPVSAVELAVPTDVNDFQFESFEADYYLDVDENGRSTLRTVETLVALFPDIDQNRGILRALVRNYEGAPTDIEVISVTDEAGAPRDWHYADEDEGSGDEEFLEIVIRDDDPDVYVHGRQAYVITYEQHNVTRYFEDTGVDEFYWDTNGTGWYQPFGTVTARVHIPTALAGNLTGATACYRGSNFSDTPCELAVSQDSEETVIAASEAAIGPFENVTVSIAFEQGTFVPRDDSYLATPLGYLQLLLIAAAIATALWAIALRVTALRDEDGRPTIIAEYAPPRDASVFVSAVVLRKTQRATAASFIDLAVNRKIRIIEREKSSWFSNKSTYTLELLSAEGLDEHQARLVAALFGSGATPGAQYTMTKTDVALSRKVQSLVSSARKRAVSGGWRKKVSGAVSVLPALAVILFTSFAFAVAVFMAENAFGGFLPFLLMLPALLSVLIVLAVVFRAPLTARGAELRDHLKGLELYIRLAEADRLRVLQSPEGAERTPVRTDDTAEVLKLYEKLLPYAVLFALEKRWAEELGRFYTDNPPDWYSGTSSFNAAVFATSIGTLSSTAATSYSGSSSSSSSGGSGGGGSSGGGGGGGGGGGV